MSSPLRYHDSWYSSEPVTLQDSETWLPTLPFTFLGLTATFRSSGEIGGVRMLLNCLIVLVHVLFKLCLDQINNFCLIPSMMEPNNQTRQTWLTFYQHSSNHLCSAIPIPHLTHICSRVTGLGSFNQQACHTLSKARVGLQRPVVL